MKKLIEKALDALANKKYALAQGLLEAALELEVELSAARLSNDKNIIISKDNMIMRSDTHDVPQQKPSEPEVSFQQVPTDTAPVKRKNIVPPGIASMMMPPTHPDFESKGSKESRYA